MVMFEVYVLKGGVDLEVDVGSIESNCILKGPHCFCKPNPRDTDEFVARSQVSTHFWCIHSYSRAQFFGSSNTSSSTPPGIRGSQLVRDSLVQASNVLGLAVNAEVPKSFVMQKAFKRYRYVMKCTSISTFVAEINPHSRITNGFCGGARVPSGDVTTFGKSPFLRISSSIRGPFSMAMLNYQRLG